MWYHVKGKEFLNGIYPYYTGRPGFPTAFRPIGYPGTLAILYFIFGAHFIVAKLFNIVLSTLIIFDLHTTVSYARKFCFLRC